MMREFSCTTDGLQPLCIICDLMLSNPLVNLFLLWRHFSSYHKSMKEKSKEFFSAKRRNLSAQQATLAKIWMFHWNVLRHYMLFPCFHWNVKHHTMFLRSLWYPMQSKLHLQCSTIKLLHKLKQSFALKMLCRIVEMSADVADQVVEKIVWIKQFALQLEGARYFKWSSLVVYMWVPGDIKFWNLFFFCKSLKVNSAGRAIFEVINCFFSEQKIKWQWCESVYTDGAALMTCRLSDFISWVKNKTVQLLSITISFIDKLWLQRN